MAIGAFCKRKEKKKQLKKQQQQQQQKQKRNTYMYAMTSSVYRGQKAIMKQTEETMKTDIVVPPLILHWKDDNYLFAVVNCFFFSFLSPIF